MFYYFINSDVAPGSYDVEKADKKIHESSPAFSLGVKYKEPKLEEIPGNAKTTLFKKKLNCYHYFKDLYQ